MGITRVTTGGAVTQPEDMVEPWSHQPELLPSLALHLLVFLVGVSGHLSLLYYLHTRHIRSPHMFTSCDCLVELLRRRHNINTGMFLASLSVAELLLLLLYLPLELTKAEDRITAAVAGVKTATKCSDSALLTRLHYNMFLKS